MINRNITYLAITTSILVIGCIEEVDFDAPTEFQNTTIVIGKIVKGNPSSIEVSIQKLFDFAFSGESFINAESVKVIDDQGNELIVPFETQGIYKLIIDPFSDFEVEIGRSYGLEIKLFDGQSFKSDMEELISVPKINAVTHRLVEKEVKNSENELVIEERIEYFLSTTLLNQNNQERTHLKWDFEVTYKQTDLVAKNECYVSGYANADLIQTVNINGNNSTSVEKELVLEQAVSNKMVEGQYVSVIQEALNDEGIQFWEQVRSLSTHSGTFYEPPPGQIFTNIRKTDNLEGSVFGYFNATQHDSVHVFVDSTFINNYTLMCPRPAHSSEPTGSFLQVGVPPCADCCFCLEHLENSTLVKPSFWKM